MLGAASLQENVKRELDQTCSRHQLSLRGPIVASWARWSLLRRLAFFGMHKQGPASTPDIFFGLANVPAQRPGKEHTQLKGLAEFQRLLPLGYGTPLRTVAALCLLFGTARSS